MIRFDSIPFHFIPFHSMPHADINYHMSPLYFWFIFLLWNTLNASIGSIHFYGILNAFFSLDYRIGLIVLNTIGLYLFLRHARIDFTFRVAMNTE